ncbi:hypothetical protein C8J56DRAFT_1046445 [Mycena floridula]|nr:hypothetical protein C8J56DRAFT_1046445 [Mycena floridula]
MKLCLALSLVIFVRFFVSGLVVPLEAGYLISRNDLSEVDSHGIGAWWSRVTTPKDPARKAKYLTGNPAPETPKGEFRQHTAGKKDDYFGNWKKQIKGVANPAAGKGNHKDSK